MPVDLRESIRLVESGFSRHEQAILRHSASGIQVPFGLDSAFARNDDSSLPSFVLGFCSRTRTKTRTISRTPCFTSSLSRRMQTPTQFANQGFRRSITKYTVFRTSLWADASEEQIVHASKVGIVLILRNAKGQSTDPRLLRTSDTATHTAPLPLRHAAPPARKTPGQAPRNSTSNLPNRSVPPSQIPGR